MRLRAILIALAVATTAQADTLPFLTDKEITAITSEIRDALSAIYQPVELKDVEKYLAALASAGVIRLSGSAP
ncbi:MAG: hypothetical protein DMF56_07490 [Acidobacteria bacterium]|nr:MAG: hypothetical protein DMF56_07490 [Acidobacteriota bacterium]